MGQPDLLPVLGEARKDAADVSQPEGLPNEDLISTEY